MEIFRQFSWKDQNFLKICQEKSKVFGNLPGKIDFFLPGSTTPHILNQIDAAVLTTSAVQSVYSSYLSWLGAQVKQKSRTKFLPWLAF